MFHGDCDALQARCLYRYNPKFIGLGDLKVTEEASKEVMNLYQSPKHSRPE